MSLTRPTGYIPQARGSRIEGRPFVRAIGATPSDGSEHRIATTVTHRSQLGQSCVDNAKVRCAAIVSERAGLACPDLSAHGLYWETRKRVGAIDRDEGSMLADVDETAVGLGIPTEETWPQDLATLFAATPPPAGLLSGYAHRIADIDWRRLDTEHDAWLDDLEHLVRSDTPVVIGIPVGPVFEDFDGDGVLDVEPTQLGYHAISVEGVRGVGEAREWRIENSWGARWADGGGAWLTTARVRQAIESTVLLRAPRAA